MGNTIPRVDEIDTKFLDQTNFLNGWIGQKLAEKWLKSRGYNVESHVKQQRGTEKSVSSGDIDLIAKKGAQVIYIEVKFWSNKSSLTPSWLVQFMLARNKLNTFFEEHADATKYMLIFRFPSNNIFEYKNTSKYIKTLMTNYHVPEKLLQRLSGKPVTEFCEEILKHIITAKSGAKVDFGIIYIDKILSDLGKATTKSYRAFLEVELQTIFQQKYEEITSVLN